MNDNRTFFGPQYLKDGMNKNLGWNVPLESSFFIHPHWRQFETPPIYYHVFFFIIFFCLMIASTFGNGIVIWIFTTSKSLRTPSNMLVVNLALFDFIMMFDMPMFLVNTWNQSPIGGGAYCDLYAVFGSISGMGAAITNAAIALDRYKTISNPMEGRMSMTKIFCIILFTWLWTIPFTVLPLMKAWGQFAPEGFLTTCTFDYLTDTEETRVFVYAIFVWSYFIPMVFICYFYFKLFLHVQAHEKMLKDQAKKMNVKSLSTNVSDTSVEIRIAKIAFTIYFLFICAWTPYGIVTLIPSFASRELITPMVSMIPGMACKSVSCIDPWVYAISHPRYRKELEKRIPWLGIVEKTVPVQEQEDKSINTSTEPGN